MTTTKRAEPPTRALVRVPGGDMAMTVADVHAQVVLIQEVMRSVMREGTHFGRVPGCGEKPSLFKAGAEKLASTFRLVIEPIVEDLSGPEHVQYRVHARVLGATGNLLGVGLGECSSRESKYRRASPWDVANTVLKMAKKRAQVDGILTVTAASDIFGQDLEDLERDDVAPVTKAPPPPPARPIPPVQKAAAVDVPSGNPRTSTAEPTDALPEWAEPRAGAAPSAVASNGEDRAAAAGESAGELTYADRIRATTTAAELKALMTVIAKEVPTDARAPLRPVVEEQWTKFAAEIK